MIQETVDRLQRFAPAERFWIITNQDLRGLILQQLPSLAAGQVLAEPVGRNTAPAIGLAAFLLQRIDPRAVIGMFPSDHVIRDETGFGVNLQNAAAIAAAGANIVVLGIRPTRAETGYGYIQVARNAGETVLPVERFVEKPSQKLAEEYLAAGNYLWNSGMFLWGARTLADALREHLPNTAPILERIAASYGGGDFEAALAALYPGCENISIDYAVLEPRSRKGPGKSGIFCVPAAFGWNDLGSWTAVYEHRRAQEPALENVISADRKFALDAAGNFVHSDKFVAVVGVRNLVVVETDDALLITTLERAQDVGKIVAYLDRQNLTDLV
jgi:mannose-1-phosphate guanylyltransferase